jgi:hypothetical protein
LSLLFMLAGAGCGGASGSAAHDAAADGGIGDAAATQDAGRLVRAWVATGGFAMSVDPGDGTGPHIANLLNENAAGNPSTGNLFFVICPEDLSPTEARLTWGLAVPSGDLPETTYRFLPDPPPQIARVSRLGRDGGANYFTDNGIAPITLTLVPPEGDPSSSLVLGPTAGLASDGGAYGLIFQASENPPRGYLTAGQNPSNLKPEPLHLSRDNLCHVWADGLNMLQVASGGTADLSSCTCTSASACPDQFSVGFEADNWSAITLYVPAQQEEEENP